MAKLEDLKRNTQVKGLNPSGLVTILNVQWHGSDVVEVTYRDISGKDNSELLFRDREIDLEVTEAGTPWAFDSDGELFRMASEAYRIRMAYLFDPWMAVHLSQVEPLPHQITAVYGEMLPRQPLRFVLADDPGAGKTIMAGLLIRELLAKFDHVVVDTPAATYGSDCAVIAARCGAALVIARQDQSRVGELQDLVANLGESPAKLAGVIVNEF